MVEKRQGVTVETLDLIIEIFLVALATYAIVYLIDSSRKKKILIAEDSDVDRQMLEALLEGSHVKLVFAKTFRSAANHLAFSMFRPHIAIIDKNLPDSDGAHLYRLCKEERVPVKMFTAEESHIKGVPDDDVFRKSPDGLIQVRDWAINKTAI